MSDADILASGPGTADRQLACAVADIDQGLWHHPHPRFAAGCGHDRQPGVHFAAERLQHGVAMGSAGIMAVGMTFVILTGGFDLSVASAYSLCAVVAAYVGQTHAPSVAFTAAIAVGLVFGLANGILVAVVRINPFITTVGSGFIINGVALVMTQNAAFLVDNDDFGVLGAGRWHGVPYSGMLLVILPRFLWVRFWPGRSMAKPSMRSAATTKQAGCPEYGSGQSSRAPMC